MLVLIKHLVNQDDTFMEFNPTPPACVNCNYYKYDSGSWCLRTSILKVFNVVTGEHNSTGLTRCQDQRYGTHENYCGIIGKFFEPK